jgi:hypothetical protein
VNVTFADTTHSDAEALVQIRIEAMRESLERIVPHPCGGTPISYPR